MQYWSTKILSKLESYVGVPLQTNSLTATVGRMGFARFLIEVNVNSRLLDSVLITTMNETDYVFVTYEWYPARCPRFSK